MGTVKIDTDKIKLVHKQEEYEARQDSGWVVLDSSCGDGRQWWHMYPPELTMARQLYKAACAVGCDTPWDDGGRALKLKAIEAAYALERADKIGAVAQEIAEINLCNTSTGGGYDRFISDWLPLRDKLSDALHAEE